MGFRDGGELAIYIREAAAPHAMRLLESLPARQRSKAISRCAAAFEAAANAKGGEKILACSEGSIIRAVLHCALIDIYPGGVQPGAYLIPRGHDLTVLVSFHGLRDLALRSGNRNIQARAVFDGEDFRMWADEAGEHVTHEIRHDVERDWDHLIAVYCIGERPDGTRGVEMLGRSQIEERRKASQSKTGPWASWPIEMSLKTAVKYAVSRGTFPITDRFALALDEDAPAVAIQAHADRVPRAAAKPAPTTLAEWAEEAPATREAPALPDHGEPVDELASLKPREKVAAKPAAKPAPKRARKPHSTMEMP